MPTISDTLLQCLVYGALTADTCRNQNPTMSASPTSHLEPLRKSLREDDCTPARVCAEIANIFSVKATAVGLLCLEGRSLRFLFPSELRAAGSIPLSSSTVAARTAETRTAEFFNNFALVRHHSIFEAVKLGSEPKDGSQIIQKLMSAPVIGMDETVLGVLQISRKGISPNAAGPDFDTRDLNKLEEVAKEIAPSMTGFMRNSIVSKYTLTFHA